MTRPENATEIYELLSALCDDCITPDQFARLETILATDEDARVLYHDYVDVHLELDNASTRGEHLRPLEQFKLELDRIAVDAIEGSPDVRPKFLAPQKSIWRSGFIYLSVMAATILGTLGFLQLVDSGNSKTHYSTVTGPGPTVVPEYVATLLKSANCVWSGSQRPQFDGQRLLSRDIQLDEGLAEFGFDSGVRIVLQGPARISIDSSKNATLHSGKLVLHGDDSAAPFELQTPHSRLLDIGTEYGASVGDGSTTEVRVFSGEVQVQPLGDEGSMGQETLTKGDVAQFDQQGRIPATLNEAKFVRKIPDSALPQISLASRLLAYEGFDYETPTLDSGNGGVGFRAPWRAHVQGEGLAKTPIFPEGLSATGAMNVDGPDYSLDLVGGHPCARSLDTPIRLDEDAVYYVSFLLEKVKDLPRGVSQYQSFSFRTTDFPSDGRKLNFGMTSENFPTMTHNDKEVIVAPPLKAGETYVYVVKIVAGREAPDQLMLRIYGPGETVRPSETLIWNCVTPAEFDDTVFDQLLIYAASGGHFRVDEIRIGTTWESVTSSTRQ